MIITALHVYRKKLVGFYGWFSGHVFLVFLSVVAVSRVPHSAWLGALSGGHFSCPGAEVRFRVTPDGALTQTDGVLTKPRREFCGHAILHV